MREFLCTAPLAAALLLVACSGEDSGNEFQLVDPGKPTENDVVGFNGTDDPLVPPPPPIPEENGADASGDLVSNGAGEEVAAAIPSRFQGEWNQDPSACGTGASDTRLRIGAEELRFYESAGDVSEVEVVNDRVIDVTASYSGEGQSWTNKRRLTLSEDGGTLTVSGDGATMTRTRCR